MVVLKSSYKKNLLFSFAILLEEVVCKSGPFVFVVGKKGVINWRVYMNLYHFSFNLSINLSTNPSVNLLSFHRFLL